MKKDYFPNKIGDIILFLTNWVAKYPTVAAALGIDASEITNNTSIVNAELTAQTNWVAKQAEADGASDAHKVTLKAAKDEVRRAAKELKKRPGYTEAQGSELLIVGPDAEGPDLENAKPILTYKLVGAEPVIDFDLVKTEGIKLLSLRGAGASEFSFLAIDTHPPYTDSRPKLDPNNPEKRQYIAWYIYEDAQIGIQSDVLSITIP